MVYPMDMRVFSLLLIALSDSWFALVVLTSLVEQLWLSSLFFAAHFLVMAAGLLWYIKMLVPSATTHEVHQPKEALTTIAHTSFTKKGPAKRRVPTVVIASVALAGLVLI